MTLKRTTPNTTSYPSKIGEATYANLVNTEVGELSKRIVCELGTVGGTATAITASVNGADSLSALSAPMSFWFTPASDVNAAATLAIDGLAAVDILDSDGNALTTGAMLAGRTYLLMFDGSDLIIVGVQGIYDIGIAMDGAPEVSEVIGTFLFPRTVKFPTDMATSRAELVVAPSADAEFSLQKNDVEFATLTFGAGLTTGTFSGSATTFSAGDVLTCVAPSPKDAALSGPRITLVGNR